LWNPDDYINQLLKNTNQTFSFEGGDLHEWRNWRVSLKNKLNKVLGDFPNETIDFAPKIVETTEFENYTRERVAYSVTPNLRVPAYLLIPKHKARPLPAVIACHGHGYGSREVVGLSPDGLHEQANTGLHKSFAVELVKRGYVVFIPEVIGFGDRRLKEDMEKDPTENSCYRLATSLLMIGKTLAGQRVFELKKGIDYLCSREEVDSSRIGCIGFSGGGQICAYTSALDERIKATVISGYTNTFESSILSIRHCIDNYLPGMLQYAELPDLIGLIAPRALFIESGKEDTLFPIEATYTALSKLKKIYDILEHSQKFGWDDFSGSHEFSGLKAFDWLENHL
jgi:dienelactone hydrolase